MPQAAAKSTPKAPRQEPRRLDAARRVQGCDEVELALDENQARSEALRCLDCKDPTCVEACPLHIDIRSFIRLIVDGDFEGALEKISERSPLPGHLRPRLPARAVLREGLQAGEETEAGRHRRSGALRRRL